MEGHHTITLSSLVVMKWWDLSTVKYPTTLEEETAQPSQFKVALTTINNENVHHD